MNLAPESGRRRGRSAGLPTLSTRVGRLGGGLVLAASLSGVFFELRSVGRRLERANEARERLSQQLGDRERAIESVRAARARIAELRQDRSRLVRWDEERLLLPELLRGLSLQVTDDVVLEELRREGVQIIIVGRTGSGSDAVAAATGRLGRVDRLQNLNLRWVERIEEGQAGFGQRFSLAGALRYSSGDPAAMVPLGGSAAETGF